MRGYELTKARSDRLRQLRRAAQDQLPLGLALDADMLFALLAGASEGARGIALTRALVFRGLRALGYSAAEIGKRFGDSPDDVERKATATLLADPHLAASLEAQVRQELVETPEPGRYVEPTGNFA